MADGPGGGIESVIAAELTAVRKRGIDRIDVDSHNQKPLLLKELDRLTQSYLSTRGLSAQARITRLKYLLRDAVQDFAQDNRAEAELVNDLLFGDSQDRVTKSAGELLDTAMRKAEYPSKTRFRAAWNAAFLSFSGFLPVFVEENAGSTRPERDAPADDHIVVLPQLTSDPGLGSAEPEVETHEVIAGYVDNEQRYVRLLAEAVSATIVGFTNERLAPMLRSALEQKRATRPEAVWESLRIVFLSDNLLDWVNDERGESSGAAERLLERRRSGVYGRRTVDVFLRTQPAVRWGIYETSFFPPVIGTLFEMPNGRRLVQLLVRRPEAHALFLEIGDTRGHYFSQAFEEIVQVSVNDDKPLLWGQPEHPDEPEEPARERFVIGGDRRRRFILHDKSQAPGWLPLVLVVNWRVWGGRPEPLLQLRTPLNASRELHHLSHLSGYVFNEDLVEDGAQAPVTPYGSFGLYDPEPLRAVRRRLRLETGEDGPGDLEPAGCCRYYHPDKENLLFYIYTCEFPAEFELARQTEIHGLSLSELLQVREKQALRKALELCEAPPRGEPARSAALEITATNLGLHGHQVLAQRLMTARGRSLAAVSELAAEVREAEEQTDSVWLSAAGSETAALGLSGLQFREFFSIVLPLYASIGIPGAAERHRMTDEGTVRRLSELYHTERLMKSIPLEL